MRPQHTGHRLWPGLLLVFWGAGLLARELGWLPPSVGVFDFWPMFIVMIGVSALLRGLSFPRTIFALGFIALGSVLLAGNLGFVTASVTRFWPVLIILMGLSALFRRAGDGEPPLTPGPVEPLDFGDSGVGASVASALGAGDRIRRQYTFSGAELRIESQSWKGGEVGVTAGGVELDLRQAQLAPEGAVLVVNVLMGGVDIRVPDTWQVQLDVVPFLGGADDMTRSTQGVSAAPRLHIAGNVTLGGVSVSN
jgi:Cell wall-active antibiotics response 4TMS YvqF/Domain of unknown function (DUF5668)